jgi:hypothetical protein
MARMRQVAVFVGMVLIASACTARSNIETTTTTTLPQIAETTTTLPQIVETTTTLADFETARLIVSDPSGAVVIIDSSGRTIERFDPPSGAIFTQPIWTSSDTIVYSQAAEGDNRLEAFRVDGSSVWSVPLDTHPFFYLAAPNSATPTLLSLRNNTDRPGLITERISGPDSIEVVSIESPIYASWSPVDSRFASHIGDARLDVTGRSTDTISTAAEGFQAPVWLPSGLVTLRTHGGDTFLSQWADGSFTDIAMVATPARFVASRDLIAIETEGAPGTGVQTSAQALPTIPVGVLTVIDLESESFTTVASELSPVFQWSPDAKRLLYATYVDDPVPAVAWHVWENGEITNFEPFIPERSWFASFVPFFDQYAQSVSLWSSDGTAFAYPVTDNGEERIMIQHLGESSARDIAPGTWVAWSPAS